MGNLAWGAGASMSAVGAVGQALGESSNHLFATINDQTALAIGGALVAVVLPGLIKAYQQFRDAKRTSDLADFDAYKSVLLSEIKALREENNGLATEVHDLKIQIADLRLELAEATASRSGEIAIAKEGEALG